MRHARRTILLAVIMAGPVIPRMADASPPSVQPGSAAVDGSTVDWSLAGSYFANMYRAGDSGKPLESKLYLRYDCGRSTVYALVLTQPNVPGLIVASEATAWIAINANNNKVVSETSGNNGTAPDFAWVGRGYDGNQSHVLGYEASFVLAPGTYNIIPHVDVYDASAQQTSAAPGFPKSGPQILLACAVGVQPSAWSGVKVLYR